MPKYQCPRCGYPCNQKNDLRKHFLIKKPCEPKLEDIPQADLLKFHLSGAIQFKSKIQLENMSEEDKEKELQRAEEYVKDLKNLMNPKIPSDVKPLTFEDISHIKEEHLNEIIEKKKYTKEYPKLVKQLVHLLYKNKSTYVI